MSTGLHGHRELNCGKDGKIKRKLKLGQILSVVISKKWEFIPSIQFTSTYVSTEQNDQDYSTTQYGIGFGCGFFR